jgi:hypothetical protein
MGTDGSFQRPWPPEEDRLTQGKTMTNKSAKLVQIDRESLIKLLEAFADVSEVLQRELMLYQMLFSAACKAKGLNEGETQKAADRVRSTNAARIKEASQESYQSLLAKIPRIVDLLASDQDAALRLLNEWTPKGPPN